LILRSKSGSRGTRADQGVCPTLPKQYLSEFRPHYACGTYRAVYAVSMGESIYAIHAFQKKSRAGIVTPKPGFSLLLALYLLEFENDLATCMTLLEIPIGIANLGQRIDLSDRDLKAAGGEQPS